MAEPRLSSRSRGKETAALGWRLFGPVRAREVAHGAEKAERSVRCGCYGFAGIDDHSHNVCIYFPAIMTGTKLRMGHEISRWFERTRAWSGMANSLARHLHFMRTRDSEKGIEVIFFMLQGDCGGCCLWWWVCENDLDGGFTRCRRAVKEQRKHITHGTSSTLLRSPEHGNTNI